MDCGLATKKKKIRSSSNTYKIIAKSPQPPSPPRRPLRRPPIPAHSEIPHSLPPVRHRILSLKLYRMMAQCLSLNALRTGAQARSQSYHVSVLNTKPSGNQAHKSTANIIGATSLDMFGRAKDGRFVFYELIGENFHFAVAAEKLLRAALANCGRDTYLITEIPSTLTSWSTI